MTGDYSRRDVIRDGSASAFALGTVGLAGCTSSLPLIGDDGGAGPAADQWLVEPGFDELLDDDALEDEFDDVEYEGAERRHLFFRSVVPEALFDNEEETDPYSALEIGSETRSRVGVAATEIDWQLIQNANWEFDVTYTPYNAERERSMRSNVDLAILSGSFDPDDVEAALEKWADDEYGDDDGTDLESEGSHEDFDCYEIDGIGIALRDDYVLETTGDRYVDPIAVLEAGIDARFDEADRWSDDEDAAALLEQFESGDQARGSLFEPMTIENAFENEYGDDERYDDVDDLPDYLREEFDARYDYDEWESGLTGSASSREIDGESTEITNAFLYESESDLDVEAFREHVDANRDVGDEWATLEDYSIESDGRTVTLTGTVRTRSLY